MLWRTGTLKPIAKSFVIGFVLFLSFRYLAEFSEKQSLVLTFVGYVGYGLFEALRAANQVEKTFSPFCVSVTANWYELLRDYKLVEDDQEFRQLWEKVQSVPAWEFNVLRSGIVFTVLTRDLIFRNGRRLFVSKVEFEERIEEIKIEHPWTWSPSMYFSGGFEGYELGLEVQKDWWEQICAADETKELAKTKSHPEYLTGRIRLVVATLPRSEFGLYDEGNVVGYSARRLRKEEKIRDAQLVQAGWKREEKDAELDLLGAPDCVEHKYFTVEHRYI